MYWLLKIVQYTDAFDMVFLGSHSLSIYYSVTRENFSVVSTENSVFYQPRPQGLLAFQYGGGRREDPGTQRTKTIADWCIP